MPFAPVMRLPLLSLPDASATAGPTCDQPAHLLFGQPLFAQPQPAQPLFGLTLLAVEDSRLACDSLRLMCQRSGARLRRAETLRDARLHLSVYRPDVVLVDMGLPDGSGAGLIRELAGDRSQPCRIVGMSGDLAAARTTLDAGAAIFIAKPIAGLRAFQFAILSAMGHAAADDQPDRPLPAPDAAALRDDLARAADWLRDPAMRADPGFVAGFVAGIARQSGDDALLHAATLAQQGSAGLDALTDAIATRRGPRRHV